MNVWFTRTFIDLYGGEISRFMAGSRESLFVTFLCSPGDITSRWNKKDVPYIDSRTDGYTYTFPRYTYTYLG